VSGDTTEPGATEPDTTDPGATEPGATTVLPDGDHDVFIIDASPVDDAPPGTWVLDMTVVAGAYKGEVVSVRATNLSGAEFDLIGMPGTLSVDAGRPSVRIDLL
jgi:hypothetical protein